MADAPQLTRVWVDIDETPDGHMVLVNSKRGRLKNNNVALRPRVALEVSDPADPFRYVSVRGRVVAIVEERRPSASGEIVAALSRQTYPWWQPREIHEIFRIAPDRVRATEIR